MISIKTKEEIAVMARGGEILYEILRQLVAESHSGVSLLDLNTIALRLCKVYAVTPAFQGYQASKSDKPFQYALCTSVNDDIVHASPSSYILSKGDVLKLDFGVIYQGFYLDSADTVIVGGESKGDVKRLIATARKALKEGIAAAKIGNTTGDIGYAIAKSVAKSGFHIVKGLTGHGIGRDLHEDPPIPNEGARGKGIELQEGMVIAIEPMLGMGTAKVIHEKNGAFRVADGSIGVHVEDTVAITSQGPLILTKSTV